MACKARMETLIGIIICLDADEKDCYEISGAHRLSVQAPGSVDVLFTAGTCIGTDTEGLSGHFPG